MAGLRRASTNLANDLMMPCMAQPEWQGCAGRQQIWPCPARDGRAVPGIKTSNNLACQVDSSYYILTLLIDFILTCELTAGAHLNLTLTELQELINHVKKAMATEGTALYSPEWAKLEKDKAWHG